jgi:hypothetical protein
MAVTQWRFSYRLDDAALTARMQSAKALSDVGRNPCPLSPLEKSPSQIFRSSTIPCRLKHMILEAITLEQRMENSLIGFFYTAWK